MPYIYNALKTLRQIHRPMWRDDEVKCLHYIMNKPWEKRPLIYGYQGEDWESEEIHRWWWDVFGKLERKMKGKSGSGWDVVEKFVAQT